MKHPKLIASKWAHLAMKHQKKLGEKLEKKLEKQLETRE